MKSCTHVRIEGKGIYKKRVLFPIEVKPYRTVLTAKNRNGDLIEVGGSEQTGYFCPRCYRHYQ